MKTDERDKIKAAVNELDDAVRNWRKEPEDDSWSWDDERAAGLHLAEAAEALILALPTAVWPDSWFQAKSAAKPGGSLSRYEERLVDELLEYLGL